MLFYAIRFHDEPKIRFAASDTIAIPDGKTQSIRHEKGVLELSVSGLKRDIRIQDRKFLVSQHDLFAFVPETAYSVSYRREANYDSDVFILASVAVYCENMEISVIDTDSPAAVLNHDAPEARETFYLPAVSSLTVEEFQQSIALITSIIRSCAAGKPSSHWLCLSDFYELTALLDTSFRNAVCGVERELYRTGTRYYIRKVQKYIEAHYCEPITLTQLAGYLGISPGYLCEIYRAATGRTVTEAIHFLRMQNLRGLISLFPDKPIQELCVRVGYRDVRFVQKLFKRFYGISMQECRKLDNGVSSYQENEPGTERKQPDETDTEEE